MSITHLWAPWRMEYLSASKKVSEDECVFCRIFADRDDRKNLLLYRGKRSSLVLNKYPYNNGHLMVVPHSHGGDFNVLPQEDLQDLSQMTQFAVRGLDTTYKPQGYNIGMNIGEAAGAGVKEHLHLHVVPRWTGDTNFMPLIAETKSMPQHLMTSYDQLYEFFKSNG